MTNKWINADEELPEPGELDRLIELRRKGNRLLLVDGEIVGSNYPTYWRYIEPEEVTHD